MVVARVKHLSKRYRVAKGGLAVSALLPRRLRRPPPKKQVTKEVWALHDVSFKVASGTVLGIIGANGAGKTTLLKVLARISPPTEGRVMVRGRVVPLLELGAAFQPEASGRENVHLNAALYGIPRAVVQRQMDDIVEFAELQKFIDVPVKRYSSGMYLRLAFSVAINMEPDILLADEVLAVGDLTFQERCLRRVEEAGREGLTVFFVSHDMAAIRRMCNRVIWINSGRVVADGRPEEVVSAYEESAWALIAGNEKGGSHRNKVGEILSTRLLDREGGEKGAISVSDEVVVRVSVLVKHRNVGFRCVLVVSADGVVGFRTVQPEVQHVDRPGVYTASVRLPAHLLSDTIYSVKAGVWFTIKGRERRENALIRHDALTFRVYDTEETDSSRGTYAGPLPGILRPRLEWWTAPEERVVLVEAGPA